MRRWMRVDRDGVLTPDEETALHDFLEALRGIDLFAFRQSCGASIYEIARVMHIIECRAPLRGRLDAPVSLRRLGLRVTGLRLVLPGTHRATSGQWLRSC